MNDTEQVFYRQVKKMAQWAKPLYTKYNYLSSDPPNRVMLAKLRSPPVIMVLQRDEKIQVIPQTSQASLPEVSKVTGIETTSGCDAAHFNPSTRESQQWVPEEPRSQGNPVCKMGCGWKQDTNSLLSSQLHTRAVTTLFLWTTQC